MTIRSSGIPAMEVLDILSSSGFNFYLTGSRSFGVEESNSDWDFYVEYSTEVENFLHENGFENLGNYEGMAPISREIQKIKNVVRHRNCAIDIQLTTDLLLKNTMQEIVRENFLFWSFNNKEHANQIWSAVALGIKAGINLLTEHMVKPE